MLVQSDLQGKSHKNIHLSSNRHRSVLIDLNQVTIYHI